MKSRVKLFGRQGGRGAPLRSPALAPALLLLASACDGGNLQKYPQTIYAPRSDHAREVLWLQNYTTYFGVVVGIIVFAMIGYILYRFRYQPGAPEPKQIHGNTRLELLWTLIPSVILAAIAVPTVQTIFSTQADPPENALTIDVIGYQWWWEFRYPLAGGDTVVTANEVNVPVGTPIHLRITSKDVIHSFWIPQMAGKRDLIPNRINHITFTPSEPGVYMGACAEYCGDSHALMQMRLIAHTPEGFQEWLRNEASPALRVEPAVTAADSAILIGERLVTQSACAGCHVIEGTNMLGRTGPNLTHFARRRTLAAGILENNADNLAAWIRNPQAIKPGALMPALGLGEDEIGYIVAYLQTLQ